MTRLHQTLWACLAALLLMPAAWAQSAPASAPAPSPTPAPTPVPTPAAAAEPPTIVPQVQRRDVTLPRVPSKDIEFGLFGGVYNAQNFGASGAVGLRVGYHITEDYFAEAEFARTKVSDDSFRAILPGGVLVQGQQRLGYGTVSLGWNALPGEVFLGGRQARASQLFLLAGIGSTDFAGQRRQTINLGLGLKVLASQRLAVRVDLRDHLYTLDLLGNRERTHNLQLTTGLSWFY